jgi:hypothetical protein
MRRTLRPQYFDGRNTIEARDRKRHVADVSELELNIRILRRLLAGNANHLSGQVKGQHMLGTLGQAPCEPTQWAVCSKHRAQ